MRLLVDDECAAFMLWSVRLACAWGWLRRCVLGLAEQIQAHRLRLRIDHQGRQIWIGSSMELSVAAQASLYIKKH
jgi:hypothetical protein